MVAWPLAHLLYWVGHAFSLALDRMPENWPDSWGAGLYAVYNRCMLWSVDLNDWAGLALWKREPCASKE